MKTICAGLVILGLASFYTYWRTDIFIADDDTDADPAWDLRSPVPDAKPFVASGMLRGIYPAGSRIKDRAAFGGFGPCKNYPKNRDGQDWGVQGTVSLVAFPNEPVAYFDQLGFALRVINRTDDRVAFSASDSCLNLTCEVLDTHGSWRAIESTSQPSCGNSVHRVFLRPEQYWAFPARCYSGPFKTRLRFRLDSAINASTIYSNEFDGQIAASQFGQPQ